jgi:hypothetical protein
MLVLVGLLGVGMAALRDGSRLSDRLAFSLMLFVLFAALVGTCVLRARPSWLGFTIFGWGYAALVFLPAFGFQDRLLTESLLDLVLGGIFSVPTQPEPLPFTPFPIAASGVPNAKVVNGKMVPLSPTETKLAVEWWNAMDRHRSFMTKTGDRITHALRIGHSIIALLMGFAGACLARFLASWHISRGSSRSQIPDSVLPE